MTAVASKYWTVFSISLAERLTYRTDFFLGTLMRFMPIVTTIFLWSAIFAGSSRATIAGLTSTEMVAYYLLVMVSRAFSSMPGLASGIALDVREGTIKKYITQPVDMLAFLLTGRVAHKLVYYSIAAGPFVIVFYLCRGYFSGWPSPKLFAAYLTSLALAFLIGFLFEALIGLLSFWFLEISSFSSIVMTLNYVLSGHMFPLDLAPGALGTVLKWLPFQYMAYFPAILFLKGSEMSDAELLAALGRQAATAFVLFVIVRLTYARGLRRYSAFGG
jgi:ABC-2 type transport system permease protein